MTFTDVPESHPKYLAIEWAAAEGLVQGFGDGTFRPEADLTRGQLCLILYRYDHRFTEATDPIAEARVSSLELEAIIEPT